MATVEERTITLGEAARRLGTTVDAVLELVYAGRLNAEREPSTGRLLVDAEELRSLTSPPDSGEGIG